VELLVAFTESWGRFHQQHTIVRNTTKHLGHKSIFAPREGAILRFIIIKPQVHHLHKRLQGLSFSIHHAVLPDWLGGDVALTNPCYTNVTGLLYYTPKKLVSEGSSPVFFQWLQISRISCLLLRNHPPAPNAEQQLTPSGKRRRDESRLLVIFQHQSPSFPSKEPYVVINCGCCAASATNTDDG